MQLEKKPATLRQSGRELWNPGPRLENILEARAGLSCNRAQMFLLAQTWPCGYYLIVLERLIFSFTDQGSELILSEGNNLSQTSQGVFGIWPGMFINVRIKGPQVFPDCFWTRSRWLSLGGPWWWRGEFRFRSRDERLICQGVFELPLWSKSGLIVRESISKHPFK